MKVKVGKCKKVAMAKVMVCGKEKNYTLTMFNDMISIVIEGVDGETVEMRLLAAPASCFNVDSRDVVYSVRRL